MNDVIRKKDTGEIGNGGEFGTKTQTDAADALLAPQRDYEVLDRIGSTGWGPAYGLTVDERIARDLSVMAVSEDLVKRIDVGWNYTHVTLNEPHPTGGYTAVKQMFYMDPEENWIQYTGEGTTKEGHHFTGAQRLDGPALFWPNTGQEIVAVDCERYPDPAPEIGMHFQGVFDGPDGRELLWNSGSSHYEARLSDDGTMTHRCGGNIHREGEPAVIHADGTEEWWIHDRQVSDPRPLPSTSEVHAAGTTAERTVTTGAKFDPLASNDELGTRIRTDIELARRTGLIPPQAEVKVNRRKIRDTVQFDVTVTGLARGTVDHPDRFGDSGAWYTDAGQSIHDTVRSVVGQHNYEETGPATDGATRARFWTHVTLTEKER